MILESLATFHFRFATCINVLVTLHILYVLWYNIRKPGLYAVPTVWGYWSLVLWGWPEAVIHIWNEPGSLSRGYHKFGKAGIPFRISTWEGWVVIVPPQALPELKQAHDSALDNLSPIHNAICAPFTLSEGFSKAPYQFLIIRKQLNANLSRFLEDSIDEVDYAVEVELQKFKTTSSENTTISMDEFFSRVITRLSTKVFLPEFSRDPEVLNSLYEFARHLPAAAVIANMVPRRLRVRQLRVLPCIKSLLFHRENVKRLLRPFLQGRLEQLPESLQQVNVVNWHIQEAKKIGFDQTSIAELNARFVILNFASVHPIAGLLVQIFRNMFRKDLDRPGQPRYLDIIRREVCTVLENNNEKWDRNALEKMVELESLIRETLRQGGLLTRTVVRRVVTPSPPDVLSADRKKVVQPSGYTFSKDNENQFHLPYGTLVAAAALPTHSDEENYPKPDEFQPERYISLDGDGVRTSLPSTRSSSTYLPFGEGKHGCPGKHFARLIAKLLVAYLVRNFDFVDEKSRLLNSRMSTRGPEIYISNASVTIHKRRDVM